MASNSVAGSLVAHGCSSQLMHPFLLLRLQLIGSPPFSRELPASDQIAERPAPGRLLSTSRGKCLERLGAITIGVCVFLYFAA